jgi:hypothetical protein
LSKTGLVKKSYHNWKSSYALVEKQRQIKTRPVLRTEHWGYICKNNEIWKKGLDFVCLMGTQKISKSENYTG